MIDISKNSYILNLPFYVIKKIQTFLLKKMLKRKDLNRLIGILNAFIDEKNSSVNNNKNKAKRKMSAISGCAMKLGIESL